MNFLMKSTLILALFSSMAFAHEKGNGGGEFEVLAVNFPKPDKIQRSIGLIKEKVTKSRLPLILKNNIIAEMYVLEDLNGYRYINRDIVDVYGNSITAYRAWTKSMRTSDIYFTKETLFLSQDEFSKLLLHEVLHHVLPISLADDESFVNGITSEVLGPKSCDACLEGLKDGVYIQKGRIMAPQVFEAWDFVNPNQNWCGNEKKRDKLDQSFCERAKKENFNTFYAKYSFLTSNVWDGEIDMVEGTIIKAFEISRVYLGLESVLAPKKGEIRKVFTRLALSKGHKPLPNAVYFRDLFR